MFWQRSFDTAVFLPGSGLHLRNQGESITRHKGSVKEKKFLHGMFSDVPRRYDLINHVITWGLDKRWRGQAARECVSWQPRRVLDLCCGTGDLAIEVARLARNGAELTAVDFSPPMLAIAAKKAELSAKGRWISFAYGDAADLPFPDGYFDCIGISFAFRNLTYKNPSARRHVAEILRVLSTDGRCVIVETSQPRLKLIRRLFHIYLRGFVSRVGSLLSGNRGAYHYLAESAARFYGSDELGEMLARAGFSRVSFHPLFLGVAGIHVAVK